jgi:twitching motility protein PilJ
VSKFIEQGLKLQESFDQVLVHDPKIGQFVGAVAELRQAGPTFSKLVQDAAKEGVISGSDFEQLATNYGLQAHEYLSSNGSSASLLMLDGIAAKAALMLPADASTVQGQAALESLENYLNRRIPLVQRQLREGFRSMFGTIAESNFSAQTEASKLYELSKRDQTIEEPAAVLYTSAVFAAGVGLVFGALMIFMGISRKQDQMNAWNSLQEQKETDAAIIRIMEELRPISKGDLVSRLTVTEHVTGSVADRINLMTEATQEALQEVKSATREAESSMENIFELAEEANDAAENATEQAQSSREMSKDGANAVARAVDKMNEARQMIQEVSKRAKNLGEVAQSIGSVTEVIEQMAEKTKVLALNTSLIASEAGEGGAKYRTLAKEIDKMSDDTKKSLTQISASVKSMQGETQQVITTVENVTAEVVNSSQMWDDALVALDKITQSSDKIEELVKTLSQTTNKQAASASEAVTVMGRLSESAQKFRTNKEESIQED